MNLNRLLWKELWQNKALKIFYLIYTIYLFGTQTFFFIMSFFDPEPLFSLLCTLRFILPHLIFFLFFSYEFCAATQLTHFGECAGSIHLGQAKLTLSNFFVLLWCACPHFLLIAVYNGILTVANSLGAVYFLHTLAHTLLNYILLPCVSIAIGAALSFRLSRLKAYSLLLLFSLLVSPFMEDMSMEWYLQTGRISTLFRLFFLITPSVGYSPVTAYGFSLRFYRIAAILFWLFLGLTGVMHNLSRLQKRALFKTASPLCLVLCVLFAYFAVLPNSDLIRGSRRSDSDICSIYPYLTNEPIEAKSAEFQISGYRMDFDIGRILSARVAVELKDTALSQYEFTLYRGYEISVAQDQNANTLRFTQSADYVTVYPNATEETLREITFIYKGFSPKYYSNSQGAFLPGYFPYYPRPGIHPLAEKAIGFVQYTRIVPEQPVSFSLTVRGPLNCYTNLEEVEKNQFSGSSTGLTVISGFYRTIEIEQTQIVYPYIELNEKKLRTNLTDFLKKHDYKKILFVPGLESDYYLDFVEFGDCLLLTTVYWLNDLYASRNLPRIKYNANDAFNVYLNRPDDFERYVKEDREINHESYFVMLDDAFQKLGKDELEKQCRAYLDNAQDKRTSREFFDDLLGKEQKGAS